MICSGYGTQDGAAGQGDVPQAAGEESGQGGSFTWLAAREKDGTVFRWGYQTGGIGMSAQTSAVLKCRDCKRKLSKINDDCINFERK